MPLANAKGIKGEIMNKFEKTWAIIDWTSLYSGSPKRHYWVESAHDPEVLRSLCGFGAVDAMLDPGHNCAKCKSCAKALVKRLKANKEKK
jgi:hypothetical protein